MNKPAIPFPSNNNVPVIGQPFTLVSVRVPMDAQLTCNCGGADTTVTILASVAAACPGCKKVYNALFNPTNGRIEMQIGMPA